MLVVDDQRLFAQSLQVVLEAHPDVAWVGTASSGEASLDMARERELDAVVMDVELPGIDGIEATERLMAEHPDLRVVMLTGVPDAVGLARAASVGAKAYLLKDSSVDEIVEAVVKGSHWDRIDVDADAVREVVEAGGGAIEADSDTLTQRELEVLGLLAEGRQPKEIARLLGITVHTCRGYVKNVLAKLDAHSALEAVLVAHREGLITIPSR